MTDKEKELDALNVQIATAQGYSVELIRSDRDYDPFGTMWAYRINKDNAPIGQMLISGRFEPPQHYVWLRAFAECGISDWARDDSAALALCLEWQYNNAAPGYSRPPLSITKYHSTYVAEMTRYDEEGDTPAEALERSA